MASGIAAGRPALHKSFRSEGPTATGDSPGLSGLFAAGPITILGDSAPLRASGRYPFLSVCLGGFGPGHAARGTRRAAVPEPAAEEVRHGKQSRERRQNGRGVDEKHPGEGRYGGLAGAE